MRSGVLLGILTVVALAGTFLTVGAGDALRNALHLNGGFGRWRRTREPAVRPRWRLGVSLRSTSLGPFRTASMPCGVIADP